MTAIQDWLEQLGLGKYGVVFAEQEITLEVVPDLTEPDIDSLHLPTGPRRRLMVEIQALRAARAQSTANLPEPTAASQDTSLNAERRQLTVMFCDLVGSTALGGRLDAEEFSELLRDYRLACGDVVGRYEGHVAQYWAMA